MLLDVFRDLHVSSMDDATLSLVLIHDVFDGLHYVRHVRLILQILVVGVAVGVVLILLAIAILIKIK